MIRLKNKDQIRGIRRSCKLLAELFVKLEEEIRVGISTWDIDQIAETFIRERGGKGAFKNFHGFPATVCTSRNDRVIHGIPSKKEILQEGDILGCDIGINLEGFFSDRAHTFALGEVDYKTRGLLERTETALYEGIGAARCGGRLKDIGKAVSEYIRPYGYGIVRSFCGHGVGLAVHEEPQVFNYYPSEGVNLRLKEGLVLAIEPMINMGRDEVEILEDGWTVVTQDGSLSAHFEHTIVILQDRTEILTTLD